jgi:hypothetical protein
MKSECSSNAGFGKVNYYSEFPILCIQNFIKKNADNKPGVSTVKKEKIIVALYFPGEAGNKVPGFICFEFEEGLVTAGGAFTVGFPTGLSVTGL